MHLQPIRFAIVNDYVLFCLIDNKVVMVGERSGTQDGEAKADRDACLPAISDIRVCERTSD